MTVALIALLLWSTSFTLGYCILALVASWRGRPPW